MSGKIVLVTGGARSGKSSFAERYAKNSHCKVAYIATAHIHDEEMKNRVALHRRRRPADWVTLEAPYANQETMREAASRADIILFDCLTLFTTNLLLAPAAPTDFQCRADYVLSQVKVILETVRSTAATAIFVTNEVGWGIVPDNALAREFRDIAGWVNQLAADCADEAYLVVSGLAVELKSIAFNFGEGGGNG